MHSFQPSRGRILLEVFCALAVVVSMVGAWRQTDASALLTAAAAAGLFAMVRLFDLGRHDPLQAEEQQRIEFEPESQPAVPAPAVTVEPMVAIGPMPEPETAKEELTPVEPVPRTGAARRKGGSRKGGGRRAGTAKVAEVIEFVPVEEVMPAPVVDVETAVSLEEPEIAETPALDEADFEAPEFPVETAHVPHAPLFEPEPFVRMPRAAFGRRGRL